MGKAEWQAFGEWIDTLRKQAGLRNNQLAEQAGVSLQWLQELRKGGRLVYGQWRVPNPKDEALTRLARALDVSVTEVLTRAGRNPSAMPDQGETEPPSDETERPSAAPEPDADRIRQLEEQVAQHEQDLAELRKILREQRKQAR